MREHQIVITLKPEQFLEVQRQCRAAGAKSMGIFVRQKLLSALGIAASTTDADQQLMQKARLLMNDLRRLHSELKGFVAESLSVPIVEEGLIKGDSSEQMTTLTAALPDWDQMEDELEQLAKQAFAISPRLGTIEIPESKERADEGIQEDAGGQMAAEDQPLAGASAEGDEADKSVKPYVPRSFSVSGAPDFPNDQEESEPVQPVSRRRMQDREGRRQKAAADQVEPQLIDLPQKADLSDTPLSAHLLEIEDPLAELLGSLAATGSDIQETEGGFVSPAQEEDPELLDLLSQSFSADSMDQGPSAPSSKVPAEEDVPAQPSKPPARRRVPPPPPADGTPFSGGPPPKRRQ